MSASLQQAYFGGSPQKMLSPLNYAVNFVSKPITTPLPQITYPATQDNTHYVDYRTIQTAPPMQVKTPTGVNPGFMTPNYLPVTQPVNPANFVWGTPVPNQFDWSSKFPATSYVPSSYAPATIPKFSNTTVTTKK